MSIKYYYVNKKRLATKQKSIKRLLLLCEENISSNQSLKGILIFRPYFETLSILSILYLYPYI